MKKIQDLHRMYVRCCLPVADGIAAAVSGVGTVVENEVVREFASAYAKSYLEARPLYMGYADGTKSFKDVDNGIKAILDKVVQGVR